ncbi:MAG: hypothetical protein ABF331_08500 [Hellea sp.]
MDNHSKRKKRISRYQKYMEYRSKENLDEGRYYRVLFSLISFLTLFSIFIASLVFFGINSKIIGIEYALLLTPWLFGLSRLEWFIGILFVFLTFGIVLRIYKNK